MQIRKSLFYYVVLFISISLSIFLLTGWVNIDFSDFRVEDNYILEEDEIYSTIEEFEDSIRNGYNIQDTFRRMADETLSVFSVFSVANKLNTINSRYLSVGAVWSFLFALFCIAISFMWLKYFFHLILNSSFVFLCNYVHVDITIAFSASIITIFLLDSTFNAKITVMPFLTLVVALFNKIFIRNMIKSFERSKPDEQLGTTENPV
ncbi:MAG: hypothetical protein LBR74_02055 [Eubacterium sp.]|nr:hypothetical protein [Eubacterium sp.]